MKYIMEHYGAAIVVSIVLVALGAVVVGIVKSPEIAAQFKSALSDFLTNIKAIG